MPTLGEKLKEISERGPGQVDTMRRVFLRDTGSDPASFDPSIDWDLFKSSAIEHSKKYKKAKAAQKQGAELERAAVAPIAAMVRPDPHAEAMLTRKKRQREIKGKATAAKKRARDPMGVLSDVTTLPQGADSRPDMDALARKEGEDPSLGPLAGTAGMIGSGIVGAAQGTYQALKEDPAIIPRFIAGAIPIPDVPEMLFPRPEKTPGSTFDKDVTDPRMQMTPATRTWQAVKDTAGGMYAIGKGAAGLEGVDTTLKTGHGLGHGLTYGTAGAVQSFVDHPARSLLAQPELLPELIMPVARAGGAALRASKAGKMGGRAGKAASFVTDVLDPQKPIKALEQNRAEINELAREAYDQYQKVLEFENAEKVAPGTAQKFLDESQSLIRARAKAQSIPESAGSKVGRGIRRAGTSALLLGEAAGGSPAAFATMAGMGALAPPGISAAIKALVPVEARTSAKQRFIDASAMPNIDAEMHVREVTESPQRLAAGIVGGGRDMAQKVSDSADNTMMSSVDAPMTWTDKLRQLDPETGSIQSPAGTVARGLSLDKMRREELATARGAAFRAKELRRHAFSISEDMRASVGDDSPHYYALSKKYIKERDKARALWEKSVDLDVSVREAIAADPQAYRTMQLNADAMSAREAYKEAKVRASILDQVKARGRPKAIAELESAVTSANEANVKMRSLEVSEPTAAEAIILERQIAQVESTYRTLEATELLESARDIPEHWAGGKTTEQAKAAGVTPRKMLQITLEADKAELARLQKKIQNYDDYLEARHAFATANDHFDSMKKQHGSVVERASKAADKLYDAEIDASAKRAAAKENSAILKDLSKERRNEIRNAGRQMKRSEAEIDAMLLEGAKIEAANTGRLAKIRSDEMGTTVLDLLDESAKESKTAKAAEKVAVRYPETDAKVDRVSGRNQAMGSVEKSIIPKNVEKARTKAYNKNVDALRGRFERVEKERRELMESYNREFDILEDPKTMKTDDGWDAAYRATDKLEKKIYQLDDEMGEISNKVKKLDDQYALESSTKERAPEPVKTQARILSSERDIKVSDEIARIVREADPQSPLGDKNFLNQTFANVWSGNILVGSFSKRARGYVSKVIANEVMAAFPKAPWHRLKGNKKGVLHLDRIAAWAGKDINALKSRRSIENIVRQRIELLISEEGAAGLIAGKPADVRLAIPTADGMKVFSGAELTAKMLKTMDATDPRQAKQIRSEAINGVLETIKSHVLSDETHSAMGREAMRSMSLGVETPGQRGQALAAHRTYNSGEAAPNIILFDPKYITENMSDPASTTTWYRDGAGMGVETDANVLSAFQRGQRYFEDNFVKADDTVTAAVKSGIRKQGGQVADNLPIFVQKGYNESVGTHLRHIKAVDDARGLVMEAGGFAKVMYLVGTTGTQMANAFSNVMAISIATGRNPVLVVNDIASAFDMLLKYEEGQLTGYEASMMRNILSTGIADSSMLSEKFGAATKLGTSQGAKGVAKAMYRIRQEVYKQGDSGPKLATTIKAFNDINGMFKHLEPGRAAQFPTGKGSYVTFMKDANGQISVNGGEKFHAPHSDAVMSQVARTSAQFAGDVMFNFNDLPGFVKRAVGNKQVMFSVFNPYLSWSHKASELPGKPGIMSNVLGYNPVHGVITDSPTIQRQKAKAFGKLAMRRFALHQSMRGAASVYDDKGIGQEMGYPGQTALMVVGPNSDRIRSMEKADLSSGSFSVVADSALRIIMSAVLYGANGVDSMYSLFTGDPKKDYRDMLRNGTETEKNAARLYYMHKSGDLATTKTVAGYFGITGTILRAQMEWLTDDGSLSDAIRNTMRMIVGGDIELFGEAAIEVSFPNTDMTSRKFYPALQKKEAFADWFVGTFFRFGLREAPLRGKRGLKANIDRRAAAVTKGYITPLRKDLLIARSRRDMDAIIRIKQDIKILERSVQETKKMYLRRANRTRARNRE